MLPRLWSFYRLIRCRGRNIEWAKPSPTMVFWKRLILNHRKTRQTLSAGERKLSAANGQQTGKHLGN
jgi:hypothetical protein